MIGRSNGLCLIVGRSVNTLPLLFPGPPGPCRGRDTSADLHATTDDLTWTHTLTVAANLVF